MRCNDIERLIIESSERNLIREEEIDVEQHTAQCGACELFRNDLGKIGLSLERMPVSVLPVELERETRLMCHAEISSRRAPERQRSPKSLSASIPGLIWAALLILIVLTVIVLVPSAKDFTLDQAMSFPTVIILSLILQNAAMLIFAPIVIRKYRSQNNGFRLI